MITSLSGSADKPAAAALRLSAEELAKRQEVTRVAKPAASVPSDATSSVVEISSEAARRAAQPPQSPVQLPQQARQAQASSPQAEVTSSPALLLNEAQEPPVAALSLPADALADTAQRTDESLAATAQESISTVKEFDDADTNQDHTVSVLERRAYDFLHPSSNRSSEPDPSATLEAQNSRVIDAELKAYTEIAKAGRLA